MIRKLTQTCFILGCARNCAPFIEPVFANIRRIAEQFVEVRIAIAYDESTDSTLDSLAREQSRIGMPMDILVNRGELSPIRTQRISNARNLLLDHAANFAATDFFVMIDLDDVCAAPMNVANFRRYLARDDWDALTWNRADYYDIWALSYPPYVVSCWNFGDVPACERAVNVMRADITARLAQLGPDELFECESAFNGIGLYNTAKFRGCRYDWVAQPLESLPREDLIRCIRDFDAIPQYRYRGEDCEHRQFHRQARERHGARIRISPHSLFDAAMP